MRVHESYTLRRVQVKAAIGIDRGRRVSVAWGSLFLLIWVARVKGRGERDRVAHFI